AGLLEYSKVPVDEVDVPSRLTKMCELARHYRAILSGNLNQLKKLEPGCLPKLAKNSGLGRTHLIYHRYGRASQRLIHTAYNIGCSYPALHARPRLCDHRPPVWYSWKTRV